MRLRLNAILSHHTKTQFEKAGRVLNVAADIRRVELDQLADLADTSSKEFLLATALRAGANSSMPAKVVALGKVLADGLSDDAKVDTVTMLALAFDDLEVPHIRVLDYLVGDSTLRGAPPWAVSVIDFLEAKPGYWTSIAPIVATLERHGIIRAEGQPLTSGGLAFRVSHRDNAQLPHRYRVTVFGYELLERLREAVDGPRLVEAER